MAKNFSQLPDADALTGTELVPIWQDGTTVQVALDDLLESGGGGAGDVTLTGTQTLTNKTLTSPVITGTPSAPTAAVGTETTQIATTAFVAAEIEERVGLVDGDITGPIVLLNDTDANLALLTKPSGTIGLATDVARKVRIYDGVTVGGAVGFLVSAAPGTMAVQNASAVAVTGGTLASLTSVAIGAAVQGDEKMRIFLDTDKNLYFRYFGGSNTIVSGNNLFNAYHNLLIQAEVLTLGGNTSVAVVGALTTSSSVRVGTGGTPMLKVLSGVKSAYDPGPITALNFDSTTLTVTGATVGATVFVNALDSTQDGVGLLVITGVVSATNTVDILFYNPSSGTITPTANDYRVTVINF